MIRAARNTFATLLTAMSFCAFAQSSTHKLSVKISAAGPVQLQRRPDIQRGYVLAFPRILPGSAVSVDIADKINAALLRDEKRLQASMLDCRKMIVQGGDKPYSDSWGRSIEVTMRGPRFLAFVVGDDFFCGGVHPTLDLTAFVYDLTTGAPVNWNRFLPKGAQGIPSTFTDSSKIELVRWDELIKRSKDKAQEDCKGAFDVSPGEEAPAYTLLPNARSGTLDAIPATFSHALLACADTVSLDGGAMKKLGIQPELIEAIKTAQALQR